MSCMKRYLVFVGCKYYPGGGAEDFDGEHDSAAAAISQAMDAAKEAAANYSDQMWCYAWAHVFDTKTKKIIWKNGEAKKDGQ